MNSELRELLLISPRGCCAGVDRAIDIVEKAILKFPNRKIYVFHQIVHNKHVVAYFEDKGVVFVEDVEEIPAKDIDCSVLILSAHGVSIAVESGAKQKNLIVIDACCPLVKKVHSEAQRNEKEGKVILLIGHAGHAEVKGTSGRVKSKVYLIQNVADVHSLDLADNTNISYVTQTTLSVDDTKDIITALRNRFPNITGPKKDDICYATQNRQNAVKLAADKIDLLLVIGSKNSSNSNRLVEVGIKSGVKSFLVDGFEDIDLGWFDGVSRVGITAGASVPDYLVQNVINALKEVMAIKVTQMEAEDEGVKFRLPKELEMVA